MSFLIIVTTVIWYNYFRTMTRRVNCGIDMQAHKNISTSSYRTIYALRQANILICCARHIYRYTIVAFKLSFAKLSNT